MSKKFNWVKFLSILLAILSVAMLFVPILTYETYSYDWEYSYGDYYLRKDWHTEIANGFSSLSFADDPLGRYAVLIGIFSWLQLISGITLLVLNLINLKKETSRINVIKTTLITANVSAGVYLIEGIVAAIIAGDMTYTFIPWIFILGTTVALRIARKATSVDSTNTESLEEGVIYKLNGAAKILRVYEDRVSFQVLKNLRSLITNNYFGGTKEIYYSDIHGIQYKESTDFVLGFIQLETANVYTKDNFNSETSFTYDYRTVSNTLAGEVVSFLKNKIKEAKAPIAQPIVMQEKSTADEIIKYKQLLDQGIISQEEFDAKKKALLDL